MPNALLPGRRGFHVQGGGEVVIQLYRALSRPGLLGALLPGATLSEFTPCRMGWDFTAGLWEKASRASEMEVDI